MRLLFEEGQSIEWQTKNDKQTNNDLQNGHKTNYDLQNGTKLTMVHIALHENLNIDQNESN
jgi:hypothetical protein